MALSITFCDARLVFALAQTKMPQTHFLSWESLNRPEQYKKLRAHLRSTRRFRVSKQEALTLKKISFWNRRPYQFSTPHVAGERVYIGADAGWLYALDAQRDKKLWKFKTEGGIDSEAQVSGNSVFVGDLKGFVYSIDAESGKELWRAKLDTEIMSRPCVSGDRLYVATMSGRLYALSARDGIELWHTVPFEQNYGFSVRRSSNPVAQNGNVYWGASNGQLIAVRESDGSSVWTKQLGSRAGYVDDVDSEPLFSGGRLWVSSADGALIALKPESGDIVWELDAGGPNDILEHEGRIYSSGSGVLFAVDSAGGNILWQQDFETPEISAAAGGPNYVAIVTTTDKLYIVDSATGDVVFERFIKKGSFGDPAIAGSRLYVLSNSSKFFSFKVRELPPRKLAKGKKNN